MKKRKKKGFVKFVKNVAEHHKTPVIGPILTYVAPAVGGFIAARTVGKITSLLVARKWPKASALASVAAHALTTGAIYYATEKVGSLRKYQDSALTGAIIALFEVSLKTFAPKLHNMLSVNLAPQLPAGASNKAVMIRDSEPEDLADAGDGLGSDVESELADMNVEESDLDELRSGVFAPN